MANLPTSNSNPGDLRYVGQTGATQGAGGFASFSNPQAGFGALLNDVQSKITAHPTWTLEDFANTYAPPSDNNDSAGYTAKLANQLNVAPNATIGSLEPRIGNFVDAIAKNEGYNGATGSAIPTADAATSQPTSQPTSNTPNLDTALRIGGGVLGAGILTGAAALQFGADPVSDVAAGAADAAVAPEVGGWLSKGWDFLTGAAKSAATGVGVDAGINAITGSGGSTGGGNTTPPATPTTPQGSAPGPEPIIPNETPNTGSQSSPQEQNFEQPASLQQVEQQIPAASQNSQAITQGITSTLQNTAGGSVKLQNPLYMGGAQAMGQYGLQGTADENNRYDATGTEDKANDLLGKMDDVEQKVFDAEGKTAHISEGIKEAKRGNSQYVNAPERPEADRESEAVMKAYAGDYADKNGHISLGNWHKIASKEGKYFDKTASNAKNAAHKSVSMAAKEMIKKNTYHKEFYEKMQKEKQNIIHAKKLNKFLQGKKVPTSKGMWKDLMRSTGKFAGIYLGDKLGGPVGAILGDMIGEKVSRAVDKRFGRNVMETKGMKAAMAHLKDQSPAIHARLMQELKKEEVNKKQEMARRESTLKFPAPAMRMGPRTGENKSIVTQGKYPPATFEQAEKRKAGRPEYGGLAERNKQIAALRKSITPTKA